MIRGQNIIPKGNFTRIDTGSWDCREVNDTHGAGQSRIHLTCICQIDNQILLCSRFFWDSPVDPHDMITMLCKMSCNMGTK